MSIQKIMKDLLALQLSEVGAVAYLSGIKECVLHYQNAEIPLEVSYKWKLGTFENTSKDESYMLEEWEECYLPDHMRMQMLGVVHHTSWDPAKSSLVLMVCEDGKVYAYADEHLHLVAENLKELVTAGITFPSKTVFHYGQSFEGMSEKELEEVRASEEMKKAKDMHRKEAEKWELNIVEAFREVQKSYRVSTTANPPTCAEKSTARRPQRKENCKRGHDCMIKDVSVHKNRMSVHFLLPSN